MRLRTIKIALTAACITAICISCVKEDIADKHVHYEYSKADTTKTEWFTIDISIDLPTTEVSHTYKKIKDSLVSDFMGSSFVGMSPNKMMKSYTEMALSYFRLSNMEYMGLSEEIIREEEMATVLRYEETLDIYPHYECDSILTYARDLYIYQGGAHGLHTRQYLMFDLRTGERIELKDIFSTEVIKGLYKKLHIAAEAMRGDGRLPAASDIFNNDLIEPVSNFYIKDSTIVFRYNPYDIAPYSYGAIELTIDN